MGDGDPTGVRTRVTAVKGRCPRPLDDRVSQWATNINETCFSVTRKMRLFYFFNILAKTDRFLR